MTYKYYYKTPDGFSDLLMTSDGEYLTGLWFEGSRGLSKNFADYEEKLLSVFEDTVEWLDIYFSGKNPDFIPKYKIENLTDFRREVIDMLLEIPFGETKTYGEIAKVIAKKRGMAKMSSRAVGGAVGWNPICIIIPCHRVVGANSSLTGYGGGINNKVALLRHENNDMSKFTIPKKGTAL
ncbi:methylated-DNA--[protein]-cysteine S-methyltransferase [Acetivibrio clariflavus]|uniref:methylated-DNA--[protein]-cysteine S-methyltransferase n=1 Tax=Acetivibrio clariflavus (strain DSM 19732 / NBRC 101661 / EBR45) TaxID=720554 RepID=G8M0Y1_ACECE|nr:methylated-DNA--[protein]-cysteine S-methyltransferase [Acetivibrio clariflavus]AEV70224.1 O-6-methylguanine DNA methyltransferase [Acetivibrio clariflavus DSM 19732]HPU42420.1 methylated-DNA--[protein]-cysteine S-methyltransferase [Acetivibrio clariflavus]